MVGRTLSFPSPQRLKRLRNDLIGSFAIFVLAAVLGLTGVVNPDVSAAILINMGLPVYFRSIRKAAESSGFFAWFDFRKHGLLSMVVAPYVAYVVSIVFISPRGIGAVPALTVAYLQGFAVFLFAAAVYFLVREMDGVTGVPFHERLILVTAPVVVFPLSAVVFVKTVLAML